VYRHYGGLLLCWVVLDDRGGAEMGGGLIRVMIHNQREISVEVEVEVEVVVNLEVEMIYYVEEKRVIGTGKGVCFDEFHITWHGMWNNWNGMLSLGQRFKAAAWGDGECGGSEEKHPIAESMEIHLG